MGLTQWAIQQQVWAIPYMAILICIACIKYICLDW